MADLMRPIEIYIQPSGGRPDKPWEVLTEDLQQAWDQLADTRDAVVKKRDTLKASKSIAKAMERVKRAIHELERLADAEKRE